MSSQVYNYTKHTLPTGGKDALLKIRTFLLAQGWVSEYYETSVEWGSDGGGGYQWNAGNDDYLQMSSNGHGGQTLRIRLYVWYDSGHTTHFRFYNNLIDPTASSAPDSNSSTPPYAQDRMYSRGDYSFVSVPSGTFNELYIFGNHNYCLVLFRCTTTSMVQINFGLPELFPEYRGYDIAYSSPGQNNVSGFYWEMIDLNQNQKYFYYPFILATGYDTMWIGDVGYNVNEMRINTYPGPGNTDSLVKYWMYMNDLIQVNSFTGKRILYQPMMLIKNDSEQWEYIGHHPCYVVKMAGLAVGEIIDYGDEQYICFPIPSYGAMYGFALRIA